MTTVLWDGHTVPEAAKARGRKGVDSQKQNLKVRGVHSVFTAQRYQKWLKTGVVARPKQIDLLNPKEMVKKRIYQVLYILYSDVIKSSWHFYNFDFFISVAN
jgi:hypothetical protein